jgi:sulfite reductase beta subunit-like hemoprotein
MPGYGTTDAYQEQQDVIAQLQRALRDEQERSRENKRIIYLVQQAMIDELRRKLDRATKLAFEAWRQRDCAKGTVT